MDTKLNKKFEERSAVIRAKSELVGYLPKPLPMYEDPLEYAKRCWWDFDMEKWENNEKYRQSASDGMDKGNIYADAFNSILDDLYSVLS